MAGQHETTVAWPAWQTPLALPAGLGTVQLVPGGELRRPREEESVSIRFKAPGVLHIVGRNGGRKLKKIWQEQGSRPGDETPRRCCFTAKR